MNVFKSYLQGLFTKVTLLLLVFNVTSISLQAELSSGSRAINSTTNHILVLPENAHFVLDSHLEVIQISRRCGISDNYASTAFTLLLHRL